MRKIILASLVLCSSSAFANQVNCYERNYDNSAVNLVKYTASAQDGADRNAAMNAVLTNPIKNYTNYPTSKRNIHSVSLELIDNKEDPTLKLGHLKMSFNNEANVTVSYSAIYECNLIPVLGRIICSDLKNLGQYGSTFTILDDTEKNSIPSMSAYDLVMDSSGKYDTRKSPLIMYSHSALEASDVDEIIAGDYPFSVIAPDEFRLFKTPCSE